MSSKRNSFRQLRFLATFALITSLMLTSLLISRVQAADLTTRTIMLGSSFASEVTTHSFNFTTVTASNIGSIQFQYCSNSPLFTDPCTPVPGLNVSSAGIFSQSGITSFSVSGATTNSNLILTRAPVMTAPINANFVFSNIVNPSTADSVVYVRIAVYDNINATGAIIDTGAVVFVVEDRFNIEAYVPPYLTFCIAVSVSLDCSSASGFLADFGEFSPNSTTAATSQMSAATNDPNGYNIFINGQTLLSGSNIIPALQIQTPSQIGQSQFGINLRANTSPSVGANPDAGPVANGAVSPNYNSPNNFRFINGETIAGSTNSSGFNRYTVSYIVNVSENQAPGVYATTLTYTAIATF